MSTAADIDRALKSLDRQRLADIAAIATKFNEDVAALKRTKVILKLNGVEQTEGTKLDRELFQWPGLREAIREFIERHDGEFTLDDVEGGLGRYAGKPSISRIALSTELWKMCNHQPTLIVLVKKGRPNIYKRKEPEV